jgi:hypothetical protein
MRIGDDITVDHRGRRRSDAGTRIRLDTQFSGKQPPLYPESRAT